ncbi:MAG: type II toxin-antitoxin system RelE/ParE family toxin [bacterium]|nr:type II toxin-antitoxin system RelE/ParE family toxin [bacterium]
MNLPIIVTPEAEEDIRSTYHWYKDKSPGLGKEFLHMVDEAINSIAENPDIRQIVYKNIKRALTRRFPYGIFYIVEEVNIVVIAVLHAKRNPKLWKERFAEKQTDKTWQP